MQYVHYWAAGGDIPSTVSTEPECLNVFREPKNRFHGILSASLCSMHGGPVRVRQPYSYSVPAPINVSKIPAQYPLTNAMLN